MNHYLGDTPPNGDFPWPVLPSSAGDIWGSIFGSSAPTGGLTAHFVQGRRYAAGVAMPAGAPMLDEFMSKVDLLPGFSGAQVYPAVGFPGTPPAGAPSFNYVITAQRSGPTDDVVMPPQVVWVVDYLPDVPYPGQGSAPPPGVPPSTTPSSSGAYPAAGAASDTILGVDKTTAMIVGLVGIVGVVLIVSATGGHSHPRSRFA
jgi:hypothetical protein